MKNIISSFEFKNDKDDELRNYQTEIKAQLKQHQEAPSYSCQLCQAGLSEEGKKGRMVPTMTRSELEDHMVNACGKFQLDCSNCGAVFPRESFFDTEQHNCIKRLKQDLEETREKLAACEKNLSESDKLVVELKKKAEDYAKKIANHEKFIADQQALMAGMIGSNDYLKDEMCVEHVLPAGFAEIVELKNCERMAADAWTIQDRDLRVGGEVAFVLQLKKSLPVNKMVLHF